MPKFKYHISTTCRISVEYYREVRKALAETGRGNKFSGNMCRDVLHVIVKQIKNQQLGILYENRSH